MGGEYEYEKKEEGNGGYGEEVRKWRRGEEKGKGGKGRRKGDEGKGKKNGMDMGEKGKAGKEKK